VTQSTPGENGTLLDITYYTDPICSWSWAFEPQWRRLRYELGEQISWRYRMGGMISDWSTFDDPFNSVSRPAQMGPHWLQVRHLSGAPLDETIWIEDPPGSSYPAGIAFKVAEQQGVNIAEAYLRRLREAVMLERRNIARREVLVSLAEEVGQRCTLDAARFAADLQNPTVVDAFREDLRDVSYRQIGRFPTLILRVPDGRASIIVGHRPYHALCEAIAYLAPDVQPLRAADDPLIYAQTWPSITAAEVAEATGMDVKLVERGLDEAAAEGVLHSRRLRTAALYSPI
jgi:predicted DsbA family dithiol-disulfide isomerase